jgi:hypothetical protein
MMAVKGVDVVINAWTGMKINVSMNIFVYRSLGMVS